MTLPENHDTRKSTENQERTRKRTAELLGLINKVRARRKPKDNEVRLAHEFLMAWAPILTATGFKVYVMLEKFAWFTPGPTLHHTNGYVSLKELATACGIKRQTLNRALVELSGFELVIFGEPDAALREKSGRSADLEVNQDARPKPGTTTLLGALLPSAPEDVDAQTLPPQGIGSLPPQGIGSHTPQGIGSLPPQGIAHPTPQGERVISSLHGSGVEHHPVSSSSPVVPTGKTDDDERAEKPTNLTPLREAVRYIVDDAWLIGLMAEARAVAPDITDDELTRVIAVKREHFQGKTVNDPVAYLKTCVLNAIAGEGLAEWRGWFAIAAHASGGQWRP